MRILILMLMASLVVAETWYQGSDFPPEEYHQYPPTQSNYYQPPKNLKPPVNTNSYTNPIPYNNYNLSPTNPAINSSFTNTPDTRSIYIPTPPEIPQQKQYLSSGMLDGVWISNANDTLIIKGIQFQLSNPQQQYLFGRLEFSQNKIRAYVPSNNVATEYIIDFQGNHFLAYDESGNMLYFRKLQPGEQAPLLQVWTQ